MDSKRLPHSGPGGGDSCDCGYDGTSGLMLGCLSQLPLLLVVRCSRQDLGGVCGEIEHRASACALWSQRSARVLYALLCLSGTDFLCLFFSYLKKQVFLYLPLKGVREVRRGKMLTSATQRDLVKLFRFHV